MDHPDDDSNKGDFLNLMDRIVHAALLSCEPLPEMVAGTKLWEVRPYLRYLLWPWIRI